MKTQGTFVKHVAITAVEKRRLPTKHYVYAVKVSWSDGKVHLIYRRYSQFFALQASLIDTFPEESGVSNPSKRILPFIPGKILFGRSQIREVALRRKELLNEYLQNLIELPETISTCDLVLEFLTVTQDDVKGSIGNDDINVLKTADNISEPILLEKYTVIANFSNTERNQLSLAAGDVVEVFEKHDNGWWFVCLEDDQGWAPSSYLEPIDGNREDEKGLVVLEEEKFICTQDYCATLPDELSLKLGDIVYVLIKHRDGWWKVRLKVEDVNAKEGLVPVTHLKKFLKSCDGNTAVESPIKKKSFKAPPRQSTVKKNKKLSKEGRNKKVEKDHHLNPMESPNDEVIYVCGKSYKSDDSVERFEISEGTKISILEKSPNGWWRVVADGQEGWIPSSMAQRKRVQKCSEIDGEASNLFVTISSYASVEDGEVSFEANEIVKVLEKHENGWWFVRVDENEGWAPSTYLEKYESKSFASKVPPFGRYKSLDNMVVGVNEPDTPYENVVTKISMQQPGFLESLPSRSLLSGSTLKPTVGPKPNVQPKLTPRVSPHHQNDRNRLRPSIVKQKPVTPEPVRKPHVVTPSVTSKNEVKYPVYETPRPYKNEKSKFGERKKSIDSGTFIALADYYDDDDDILSFKAGQNLHITQKDNNGWWFGECGGESGWIPSNYLKPY